MKQLPITAVRVVLKQISHVNGRFSIQLPKTKLRLKVELFEPYQPKRSKYYPRKRSREPFRRKSK